MEPKTSQTSMPSPTSFLTSPPLIHAPARLRLFDFLDSCAPPQLQSPLLWSPYSPLCPPPASALSMEPLFLEVFAEPQVWLGAFCVCPSQIDPNRLHDLPNVTQLGSSRIGRSSTPVFSTCTSRGPFKRHLSTTKSWAPSQTQSPPGAHLGSGTIVCRFG